MSAIPIVAMTREMGSLGRDVAARLAQRHGRRVLYHEIIDQLADKMRLRKSHVARLLEGRAGLWEKLRADQTSLAIFTADETFRVLLDEGTGVIRGWGAVHLLAGVPHVIRVRICAPLELRIERMMERLGTADREGVQREVELSEEAHTAIARRHFHVDWRDPEHYDVVLSTGRLTVEECADEIERVMQLPRFQPTPDSMRLVHNRALEWSVRAALRRDARTADSRVRLECIDGFVRVTGSVASRAQAQQVSEAVAAVAGVRNVDNQLFYGLSAGRVRAGA
ncbi:MAG TPA: cytidylate kinase family protein [Usitatibacter sp.]|nr:cytidylate kinase family protein [Usitatibacter sp.]